jgi:vitamin B12 transporter
MTNPDFISSFFSRPKPSGRRFGLVLGLILAGCGGPAGAEPIAIPQIVISATAIPTQADQIASSVTVITGEDMQRDQRRTVPDALSTVPGLNIIQAGGPGSVTSVFTRGTNSNHTKILIDGIDVSDPSNPGRIFDLGQLQTSDIERIEVLRGPQSGLYGADALGGVISIVTKKGEGPPKITGTMEGGSFGTFNQTASLSGSQSRFNYAFNVAHLRSTDTPVTPLELLPPGGQRINDFYDNKTYSTKLGADLNDSFGVNLVARYTDATLRFTGDDFSVFPAVPAAAQSSQVTRQFFTRGEAVWSLLDDRFKNYFGVNYTDHWNWNKSPDPVPAAVNKGDRTKYDWRGVVAAIPGQTLVMGLEQETERLRTDTVAAQNGNKAGYVELQSEFAKRLFVVANVRRDVNESFGGHVTYRVAPAVLVPVTETKLKASYGTGFKAPTLTQLFVDFPAFNFFANPNLRPEESTGYDLGFEQPLASNRLRFGATYFHNDIKNLINANATFTTLINIDRAMTEGVETFISVDVTERLKLRGDYTYTKAIDVVTGLELLRRPRHKTSVTASWNPIDPLLLSATVLRVGEWIDGNRDFSIPRLTAPGYTVVDVAANYTVNEHATVFGRIDNLFNAHYQNPTGFERPGFGIFGGLRLANR